MSTEKRKRKTPRKRIVAIDDKPDLKQPASSPDEVVTGDQLQKPVIDSKVATSSDESTTTSKKDIRTIQIDSSAIQSAGDEYTSASQQQVTISTNIDSASDTEVVSHPNPSIQVKNNIDSAPDEFTQAEKQNTIIVNSDVSSAPDEFTQAEKQNVEFTQNVNDSPDEIITTSQPQKTIIGSDLNGAGDTESVQLSGKQLKISSSINGASDEVIPTEQKQPPVIKSDMPSGADEQVVATKKQPTVISDKIYTPESEGRSQRFENGFNGAWMSGLDPYKIGNHNFSLLQNFRYTNDGIEGTGGNSRINTTSLGAEITTGIQFKTNYDTSSYVLIQRDDGSSAPEIIANTGSIPNTNQFTAETVDITGSSNTIVFQSSYNGGTSTSGNVSVGLTNGTYGASPFATHLQNRMNANTSLTYGGGNAATNHITFTVTYSTSTRKFTITAGGGDTPQIAYVNASSTCDTEMGWTQDHALATSITTDAALSSAGVVAVEDSSAELARMAELPSGNIGICDQKNNYIWAGEDMPCGAFLKGYFAKQTIDNSHDVLVFTSDEGGPVNIDVPNGDYTCDELATALQNAMNGDATLTGSVITFSVSNRMGRTYIDAGTGHTIAFTVSGSDAYPKFGMMGDLTAARTNISRDYMEAAPYINDNVLVDCTERINNNLTDSSNTVTVFNSSNEEYFLLGATRPIKGFTIDITSANTSTSTMTVKYFNGSYFTEVTGLSDGTSADGKSLAQDGSVSFTDTDGSVYPSYHGGYYLYFYLVEVSDGYATLANITLDAAMQDVNDLWDGEWRSPIKTSFAESIGTDEWVYKDYTLEMLEKSYQNANDKTYEGNKYIMDFGTLCDDEDDRIELIFEEKINAFKVDLFTRESTADMNELYVECWDGDSWMETTMSYTTDINRNVSLTNHYVKSGHIFFNIPSGTIESKINKDGVVGYAYRIGFKLANATTPADLEIDQIFGLPRASTLTNRYKFPFQCHKRAMWCNSLSDKEYNRVDYSATDAPDVYNGEDASGLEQQRSLYFGGSDALNCATELFALRGDTLDSYALFFKNAEMYMLTGNTPEDFRIHTISKNIGCPAPKTLTTAEVSFGQEGAPKANVALWLSDKGPCMWHNTSIYPIPGIENYFDPYHDDYIDNNDIDQCAGWYDPTYKEYNLLLPVNTTDGTLNTWLVYSLVHKKWYEKSGETYFPQGGFQVEDTDGNKYIYAYDTTGYMYRVENGLTWSDGSTTIDNVCQTADISLTESLWDEVIMHLHKIVFVDDDNGTITVDLYIDGDTYDQRYTVTNTSTTGIAFVNSDPDTITDTASGFVTEGFQAGDLIKVSGTTSNDGVYEIASVVAGTITLVSGDTLTAESLSSSNTNTVTIQRQALPYQTTMAESDNYRYKSIISYLKAVGKSFKFRITCESCTINKPKLLAWGVQYEHYREDNIDKSDLS